MIKIKIPGKWRKVKVEKVEGEAIEVRMPMTPNETTVNSLPFYQVRGKGNGWSTTLAVICSERRYNDGRKYDPFIFEHEKNRDGTVEYPVTTRVGVYSLRYEAGVENTPQEADALAHRTAVSIGLQLANDSGLPLEDYSREDKSNLEKALREIKEQAIA